MIKKVFQIIKNQGLRYTVFRAGYEFKRKSGLLKRSYHSHPKTEIYPSLEEWKKMDISFVTKDRAQVEILKRPTDELAENYANIKSGKIKYFNKEWIEVADWLVNPSSNYKYDIAKHWTEVEDLSAEAGDIKYVWEKSRFSFLYDIIRYDHHFEEDSAEYVFTEIKSWIDANPINMGPQYKCSQETSLRCLNWIFALHFYKKSTSLTEELWQKIMRSIHWQIKHVYTNINFSRICVRNNHAITECMMIYFGGLLFPYLSESEKWKKKGKQWLEEEIGYQVYEDGTFLQFSHNYQRVLVQLLTYTIVLSRIHKEELTKKTIDRAVTTYKYMSNVCVGVEGQVPNYGSNDGALFFKFNDLDYTDFRPQINGLYAALTTDSLYKDAIGEDALWFCQNVSADHHTRILDVKTDLQRFRKGGVTTIKDGDSYTFIKCSSYKDRPSHADNMHIEMWHKGQNIFRDSGTYKYNTDEALINYFAGSAGHNTIMIDDHNQMTKGPRFIWYDWTRETDTKVEETDKLYVITLSAKMYPSSGAWINYKRIITKTKGKAEWVIEDQVVNKDVSQTMRQLWHPNPKHVNKVEISAVDEVGNTLGMKSSEGYWSEYYGVKEDVPVWAFVTHGDFIKTKITIV